MCLLNLVKAACTADLSIQAKCENVPNVSHGSFNQWSDLCPSVHIKCPDFIVYSTYISS